MAEKVADAMGHVQLVVSTVAYYSASMVMIAQKTQARRDRASH
jgi:uncharacterized membrane protein